MKQFDQAKHEYDLSQAPFWVMECVEDVDDQYFIFENLLKDVINDYAPLKTKRKKAKEVPFMNRAYRKSIMNTARLKHRHQDFPTRTNWNNYVKQRNQRTKIRVRFMNDYFKSKCGEGQTKNTFWPTIK